MYSIVIIGAGLAGASIAYNLCSIPDFKEKILLIESGEIGRGIDKNIEVNNNKNLLETSLGDENNYKPWISGSFVLENPNRIKMILTAFGPTAKEFYQHHGLKGMSLYNKIASLGRDNQITLGNTFLNDGKNPKNKINEFPDDLGCIQLGSLIVCYQNDAIELKNEFELLKKAGFEIEWWDKEKIEQIQDKETDFFAGIFYPKDGIIDSTNYSKKLIEFCITKGLELRENTLMKSFEEDKVRSEVIINLNRVEKITTKNLILATGGLYSNEHLQGILKPCYSYLTTIKIPQMTEEQTNEFIFNRNSPNFITFRSTHDWAICQGSLRISGEDHYSALKNPRLNVRCKNLEDWCYEKYPKLKSIAKKENITYINGVYSETPDYLPLIGKINDDSKITYLMGCNAVGQAILSGAATLIPGLLGYRQLNKEEEEYATFMSIRRFRILNANQTVY